MACYIPNVIRQVVFIFTYRGSGDTVIETDLHVVHGNDNNTHTAVGTTVLLATTWSGTVHGCYFGTHVGETGYIFDRATP